MISLNPSTWNALGLGVAASFAALGLGASIIPYRTAETFGLRGALHGHDSRADIPAMMSLVSARDLSIAAALFALGRSGRNREMGTVILSTMILCAVDTYVVWKRNRKLETLLFTVGATIWGVIGLGLHGTFD